MRFIKCNAFQKAFNAKSVITPLFALLFFFAFLCLFDVVTHFPLRFCAFLGVTLPFHIFWSIRNLFGFSNLNTVSIAIIKLWDNLHCKSIHYTFPSRMTLCNNNNTYITNSRIKMQLNIFTRVALAKASLVMGNLTPTVSIYLYSNFA